MKKAGCYFAVFVALAAAVNLVNGQQPPNFVLIFTDDQGYGDIGCYGATGFKTPHLDRMAREGVKLNEFYSNCPVCTGSRAALMTGCHYRRLGIPPVLFPRDRVGLHPNEITIAELLKTKGYATACVGKWHLGHLPKFLPSQQGFDFYFGVPYSNDMWIDPEHAQLSASIRWREGVTPETIASQEKQPRNKVPLMRNDEVVEYPADQDTLTRRYTEETIAFIKQHRDKPFFVYVPHTQPHLPLHVHPEFAGRTKSRFGDIMEEIDWSVGQIMETLADLELDENTLVMFTTDNGTRMGSSGPLRGKKFNLYEGGVRVPCLMRWPGQIPAGQVCEEVAATIDVLPTFGRLAGATLPSDRVIDGKNIWPLINGTDGAKSPHDAYCLAHGRGSVRSGKWKFYAKPPIKKEQKKKQLEPVDELYNLESDLGEKNNVATQHPDVVTRLRSILEAHREDLKNNGRPVGKED